MSNFIKTIKDCVDSLNWDIVLKIIIVILVIILIKQNQNNSLNWDIVLPIFIAILAWYLNEKGNRYWEKWKLKKEACMQALNIADAILSNYKYENFLGIIDKQEVATEDVRKCYNLLACSCNNAEVINILKEIIGGSVSPDIIINLRNAVRKELGFGNIIDEDKKQAFIARLPFK